MLRSTLSVARCFVMGAAVMAAVAGRPAQAEVFPSVTLVNSSNPMSPFNYANLLISRELVSPGKWLWTYDVNNLKDTGTASTKVAIHRFLVGIDSEKAGLDWQSHVWTKKSQYSNIEVPNPFVPFVNANFEKNAILNSDSIEWNWDNQSPTNKTDDFLAGTMRFQFETDLPLVTYAAHEVRDGKGPGAGIGASPAATPEPASMLLLLGGTVPLFARRRRHATPAMAA